MAYMIKPGLPQLRQRLRAIHEEMGRLLPALLGREPLLCASLSYRPRTCGNPGCRCARGQRHPAWIVQFSRGGRSHCRSVGRERYERLLGPAEAYRGVRAARVRWNRLAKEAARVVAQLERGRALDTPGALEEP